jgi:hypothetical protein
VGAGLQDIATGKVTAADGLKAIQAKAVALCQKCFLAN